MYLLLQIPVIYIKEIITNLQKLYSPPKKSKMGNKSPMLFVKKPCCTDDLLPAHKILFERPAKVYSIPCQTSKMEIFNTMYLYSIKFLLKSP